MPEIKTSTHYWNACNRNGAGAICAGFSGFIYFVNFCRTPQDGVDYHFA